MNDRLFTFVGSNAGPWRLVGMDIVVGDHRLPSATHLAIVSGVPSAPLPAPIWQLRGIRSHERYVARTEHDDLAAKQPGLDRPEATCAALIPIRKTAAWWSLSQDERRRIFEEQSHHIKIGLDYLPAVARRLHHCRDLSESEPFDFLTWFEYAPADAAAFDRLVAELRRSPEWAYVDREIDLRYERPAAR